MSWLVMTLVLEKPDFRHLAAPAIAAQAGFTVPDQAKFACRGGFGWNFEFEWSRRPRLVNEGMNLHVSVAPHAYDSRTFVA